MNAQDELLQDSTPTYPQPPGQVPIQPPIGSAPQPPSSNPASSSSSRSKPKPPPQKKKFGSLRDLQRQEDDDEEPSDKEQEFFAGGDKSGLAVQDPSQRGGSSGGTGPSGSTGPEGAEDRIQRLLRTAREWVNFLIPLSGSRSHHCIHLKLPWRSSRFFFHVGFGLFPTLQVFFHSGVELTPCLYRRGSRRPPPGGPAQPRTAFTGAGQTLGGDDTPSTTVPDPDASRGSRPQLPMVQRTLHLWQDGFSVDDGPLYRYDDPRNARTLDMINNGSAPLDIMGVESGQAVDVKLNERRTEKYLQPKKKYKPFSGSGQRLGSPTPGVATASSASASTEQSTPVSSPATASIAPSSSAGGAPAAAEVDESSPILTLQLRLPDGTRLPSRFNTSHTIGDVQQFVQRASTEAASGRAYTLATTFPTKGLNDPEVKLGDVKELGRGGVVVVKWT